VDPYVAAHAEGLTPNPCVECNRHIKFDALLDRTQRLGFDRLATGHHVRLEEVAGAPRLLRGADAGKDQSYVLYMLSSSQLEHLVFPVGASTKSEVRDEAARLELRTADKPDSQDVCFITEGDGRRRFLAERIDLHPGELVDAEGTVVGVVDAVELVTIGQRKGLDLGGNAGRTYAVSVDAPRRKVVVGPAADLDAETVALRDHCWTDGVVSGPVLAQTSAHGSAHEAVLEPSGELRWVTPQRRVAPGQIVVLYRGDRVLGGATAA
ncbi:MAG: tRNA 2-thiouridine(34) synthase MnmA, partial [Actinomycetota bacterium]|nr:tRNA 2-thiouridine(34) synthase MnmA [Actinomycetota bacterium]